MNNKLWISLLAFFSSVMTAAQSVSYSLKVEMLISNTQKKAAGNINLLINGTRQTTDPQGMIYITLNKSEQSIRVDAPDENDFVLAESSRNGVIDLPANTGAIVSIFIRNPNQKEKAYIELNSFYRNNRIEKAQLDSIKNADFARYEQIIRMQDSIYAVITKHYKISETDLRNASEIMDGRDLYFRKVSHALQGYLNEAKDVRDGFKKLIEFSLENQKAFQLLDSTIRAYNDSYNRLNKSHDEYERAIENYWKSFELGMGFHNVIDFALNDIHRATIIPLNTTIISKANEYNMERKRKRKEELKKELQAGLDMIIPILDNDLGILSDKVQSCIAKLAANKNLFPD